MVLKEVPGLSLRALFAAFAFFVFFAALFKNTFAKKRV